MSDAALSSIRFYEPHPAWRWHGLGMLQREISDEMRVHVWHPTLVKVPAGLRRVHDHRFELSSLVLIGSLIDHAYSVKIYEPGERDTIADAQRMPANTKVWAIKHAKIQQGAQLRASQTSKPGTHPTTPGDDPDVELIGLALADPTISTRRFAGDLYTIARGDFHQSEPTGLAITLVQRRNFAHGISARVLGDHAHSAIAGQHATIERDDAVVERVLAQAREVMRTAALPHIGGGGRW